ncbi:MAG: amidohydrolase [Gammaproteobacteria bacterium]
MRKSFALFLSLAATGTASASVPPADLVLEHGTLATLEANQPTAQALAVRGGRIVAVGSDADIQPYIGKATQVIDLKGAFAMPGFIEGHGHFLELGDSLMQLDLTKAKDWDGIVAMVAEAAKKAEPGAWIIGRGWHQEKWTHAPQPNVDGYPLHASLDAVSPNNPVMLTHASGHGVYVNAVVLKMVNITKGTPDPEGGQIVKDASGEPVGFLRDNAMNPVHKALDAAVKQRGEAANELYVRQAATIASMDALSKGITGFVDQGESFAVLDQLKKLAGEGVLPLRLYAEVDPGNSDYGLDAAAQYQKYPPLEQLKRFLPAHRIVGFADDHFTVRAVGEVYSDGALGTHTAWFLKPYDDLADSTGVSVLAPQDIRAWADAALVAGYQVTTHAIGDRANREVLDVYQAEFAAHPQAKDLRWRIEHAQHLDPADIPRFGKLGVIASMQSIHECSDAPYVVKRLGEERAKESAYAWHSLIATGAIIANGTDVPVEDEDPIPNFYCAVTRRSKKDSVPFHPEQAMTREEALRSYTWNNAYATFSEPLRGSLAVGKYADITVLSQDIMSVPVDAIPATQVMYTLVGGKLVYRRP